jgi:GDPmannose 4,6-dehydratase
LADATKTREKLGWEPKVTFKELVGIMIAADLRALEELRQCQDVIRQIMNQNNKP